MPVAGKGRGARVHIHRLEPVAARDIRVGSRVSGTPERGVRGAGTHPCRERRGLLVGAAQAGGIEQEADPLFANLEEQPAASQQRRTDGSEIDVVVVEELPVRWMEVVFETRRGGELDRALAELRTRSAGSAAAADNRR